MKDFFLLTLFSLGISAETLPLPPLLIQKSASANGIGIFIKQNYLPYSEPGIFGRYSMHFTNGFGAEATNYFFRHSFISEKYILFHPENTVYSKKETIGYSAVFGVSYKWLRVLYGVESQEIYFHKLGFSAQVYPTKSIFIQHIWNPAKDYRETSISVLSGSEFQLGLTLGERHFERGAEWFGSASLSLKFGNIDTGYIFSPSDSSLDKSTGYGFVAWNTQSNNESLFNEEINPFVSTNKDETGKPKENKLEKPKFQRPKKEPFKRKVYELTLDELLKAKIPLVNSLAISKASKNSEDFEALLRILPQEISGKVKRLQYEKRKKEIGK